MDFSISLFGAKICVALKYEQMAALKEPFKMTDIWSKKRLDKSKARKGEGGEDFDLLRRGGG